MPRSRKNSKASRKEDQAIDRAKRRTSINPCKRGQILRRSYKRRNGSRVRATCIRDVGRPGYGAEVIPPLTRGLIGQYGYSTYVNKRERHDALNTAIDYEGLQKVYNHLRNLVTLQRWNPRAHDIMLDDFNYLRREYYPDRIGKYETVGY